MLDKKERKRQTNRACYLRNKERQLERQRLRRKNNPEPDKRYMLKARYGLTIDDVEQLVKNQQYLCAICESSLVDGIKHIDHDHKTKQVRGILCHKCNLGLGLFKDSAELLIKASNYLNK